MPGLYLQFKDWKIKTRLILLTFITITSIILLGLASIYFFRTTKVLGVILNAERVHNNTFQEGVDKFYNFMLSKDPKYYSSAILKLEEANQMALVFAQVDRKMRELSHQEFVDLLYNTYKEAYIHDKDIAYLMANRLEFLVNMNSSKLQKAQNIALKGYKLGNEIKQKILSNKKEGINDALHQDLQKMREFYSEFAITISEITKYVNNILFLAIFLMVILLGSFITWSSYIISKSISRPVKKMVKNFKIIASGNLQGKIQLKGNNEIGELARSFSEIQVELQKVIKHAQKVAAGDFGVKLQPKSDQDELIFALNKMTEDLEISHKRNLEESWLRNGINDLNDKLKGDQKTVEVSQNILYYLATFLEVELGVLYIHDNDRQLLRATATYGLSESPQSEICEGEGLIGEVARDKTFKQISDLPKDYFKVFSGSGEMAPVDLLIVPLLFDNELWGVLELASVRRFSKLKVKFLNEISETMAVKIASSIARLKVQELLNKTQDQASELQVQQEELRVANEELAEHTKILTENEKKLQVQQEELRVANEELEERTNQLEIQKQEIEEKNLELQSAHDDLERKARELEQTNQYKSEFLANMSHELRTPLNSLLILSGMLSKNKEGNLSPDQIKAINIVHRSGSDLLELINEILDLSKIEAGKMNFHFEEVPSNLFKKEILMNFQHLADEKKLNLNVEMQNDFPDTIVTDKQRLTQIIKNLLSNALKFTLRGSISVKFERPTPGIQFMRENLKYSDVYSISVTDTGVGIPDEKKEAIFEAFQQADGSISRQYGGTGLGLSISKELAMMLGGEIHLESKVNKGSTFTIYLPVEPTSDETSVSDQPVSNKPSVPCDAKSTIDQPCKLPEFIKDDREIPNSRPLVIIIHPDRAGAESLYHRIQAMQFKAVVADNIPDALQLIEAYHPVAIIMGVETTLISDSKELERLKENKIAGKLPLHIVNPVEGIREKQLEHLTIAESVNFEKAVSKIKRDLLSSTKRILVVEDNEVTRKIIRNLVSQTDATIDEAASGGEAFRFIRNQKYDCLILDLVLPDFSGKELLDKLAARNIGIPNTIIYTGKELTREEHRQLSRYTNSIILKGLKSDERLMDEVTLFLHEVATHIPDKPEVKIANIDDTIFKGKKILVVDDEIRNVFALGKILEDKEMEVYEAENGKAAIEVLKENKGIDLVIMDVMMPEMDGYEAIATIREIPEICEIPIICLTAKAMKEDYEKAIRSGANDYLAKPVDENKLFPMLKIWLYN